VKCVTDKAYGQTRHLWPLHTSLQLRLMAPADRVAAEEEDMSVEMSFNNIVCKLTHIYYFPTHRILQSRRSNWPYLHCLCDLQVLFYNLLTCAEGHGNTTNGIFGIAPPYNLLIPLINGDNE
jgi:hypothetical protein